MKLLALIEQPEHVCYRYRIAALFPYLRSRGWSLEVVPLAAGVAARTRQLFRAERADVVVLQRKLLPFWQLSLLRRCARVLVYDFDDALFHRDSYSRRSPRSWNRLAHFWATVYAADRVLAGNPYLARRAAELTDPQRVFLMPTCLEPGCYPVSTHLRVADQVKLVWIGQQSTLTCLHYLEGAFALCRRRLPGLELEVICDRFPELQEIRVVPRRWSQAHETRLLAQADIGISWLPDDPWSLGKCGLKVLQYMAAGLPVVANPVGMNRQMVLHGRTGFLAATPEQWAEAIVRLACDPALRRRMGAQARLFVERHWSTQRWGPVWAELIHQAAAGTSDPPQAESPRPAQAAAFVPPSQ